MNKILMSAALAAASLIAVPSQALTFSFSYTSTNAAAPLVATGRIITANSLNANGTYDVLSIAGNVDGDIITALTPNPNQPNAIGSADGLFTYDNTLSPTAAYVTNPGLLFTSATFEYNLFSDSPTQYELYQAANGGYVANSVGTLVVSQLPEPASWALMVTGLGLVGYASRRRLTAVSA